MDEFGVLIFGFVKNIVYFDMCIGMLMLLVYVELDNLIMCVNDGCVDCFGNYVFGIMYEGGLEFIGSFYCFMLMGML